MKKRIAVATLAVLAMAAAPLAGAKPNGNGNRTTQPPGQSISSALKGIGNKPATPPGQTISSIAKSGAGPAGILGSLIQRKPTNKGLRNALERVTKPPTPTPTPDPTPTPTPDPTPEPTPTPEPAP